ncbi:hypothetical protein DICPUDRAFT_78321 [Dictyostelium purpureum]|uniref:Nuclear envelope membrane protein n=1 Tax=Dictyostelium purpureum TaxID=5786 RepID=F0ZJ75_DICPU|nr:uncharacterized protein DICPUDRAFT_78321 [Dictyostelium purpureum]EGC36012.1 hypothetical protein DICPUDRAFT_78321 [Dictyostelium purpureum]|eukprot:XP_003287450.1 hypothetical protein DICPUDRAFT_78321 [Dictyostelium purpureum]
MKTFNRNNNNDTYIAKNTNNNNVTIFNKLFSFIFKLLKIIISLLSALITSLSVVHLVKLITINNVFKNNSLNIHTGVPTTKMFEDLAINSILVSIFILQHSLMACKFYKSFIRSSSFAPLERSIYNLITSIVIEAMIENWRHIDFLIWNISEYNYIILPIKKFFILVIIIEFFLFDVFELLGIAQVYCDCFKNKEYELSPQRNFDFYTISRHPNIVSLLVLVWLSSSKMTLDLFSLCLLFSLYLFSGNSLRNKDRKKIK